MSTSQDIEETRPPCPPFTLESATKKVKAAQNLWNTKNPSAVVKAYTLDTTWRNRADFFTGRETAEKFLTRKWEKEHFYILRKELFAFSDNKIAVQFFYEWNESPDGNGQWWRSYGLEDWTFESNGLMSNRQCSISDVPIKAEERWFKGLSPEEVETAIIPKGHI